MKNYSFAMSSDEHPSREKDLLARYRHSQLKATQANQRIQEIKKKYDTPSRRERLQSLKKSQDIGIKRQAAILEDGKQNSCWSRDRSTHKEDYMHHQPAPTFGSNPLKQSFAVNRLDKSILRNESGCKQLDNLRQDYKNTGASTNNLQSYSREDEEALFSKVRQMKESLISKQYMRSSINDRNSLFKQSNLPDTKGENSRCFDPRVENIDKINSKIKQILSCLNQNERQPSKYLKEGQNSGIYDRKNTEDNTRQSYFKEQVKSSNLFGARQTSTPQGKIDSHASTLLYKTPVETPQPQKERVESGSFIRAQRHQTEQSMSRHKPASCYQESNQDKKHFDKHTTDHRSKYLQERRTPNENKERSTVFTKTEADVCRTPSYVHSKHFDPKGLQVSRSKSHIGVTTHQPRNSEGENDRLKSGKKLNDEITRIQAKIQEMQTAKKRLNIQFTPFSMKQRSSSALATGSHLKSSIQINHKVKEPESAGLKAGPHFRSSSLSKDPQYTAHFGRPSETKIRPLNFSKEETKQEGPSISLQNAEVDIKTVRIDNEGDNTQIDLNNQESDAKQRAALEQVKKRTDDGINERRKRLNHQEELIKTDSLKKLIALFCEQVKLDQQFRNMKMWLQESNDKHAFDELSKLLSRDSDSVSLEQCKDIFKVEQSEHNPFFTLQGFTGSVESAASAYQESSKHWKESISHQFEKESLLAEGFTRQKMDLQRKGYIELEDLVRLLNIESGTFYRNRDIFLIFRRLTGKDRASFDELLEQLCG